MLKIVSDLLLACDRGQVSLLALLDLSAAFDTVDHEILLDRLHQAFGIRGSALEWVESFVTGRVQTVVFAGEKSVESSVLCGVVIAICLSAITIRGNCSFNCGCIFDTPARPVYP